MSKLRKILEWLFIDDRKCTTIKCYVNCEGQCCYVGFHPKTCSEANMSDHKPKWVI